MENKNKYNKEIVIWLRGQAESINTDELNKFHVKLTTSEGVEHIIKFNNKDLHSVRHNENGKLQIVYQKDNAIPEDVYIESVEMCEDFPSIERLMSISKLYIRIGHNRWFRLVDKEKEKSKPSSKKNETKNMDEAIDKLVAARELLSELVDIYNNLDVALDKSDIIISVQTFKSVFDSAMKSLLSCRSNNE